MPAARHPIIAREGWPALTIIVVAAAVLYGVLGFGGAAPAVPVFIVALLLLRDPHREPPALPLAVVSPIDGAVSAAGAGFDPWLGREAVSVTVTGGVTNVHSIYSPIEGKLVEQWTKPKHERAPNPAQRHALAYQVRTDEGDDVVMEIVQGAWRGPIQFPYQPGERIGQGRRIGYAPLGCTMVIYAPEGSRLDASDGDSAEAATTVLATLVHEEAVSSIQEGQPA